MRKKALLALLMALTLILSSCSLIVKDEVKDNASEIIRLGDQVITKAQVKNEILNELDSQAYLYSMYGQAFDSTDPANIAAAQSSAIKSLKDDLVLTAKAKELGFDQLTDEETENAKTKAEENWNSAISYIQSSLTDAEKEGKDEAALKTLAEEKLTQMGISLESYIESQKKQLTEDKLRESVIKDVAVTDEEIQADFDSKVEADKTTYGENAASYAQAVNNGTTVYYAPAGVRRVKQILTKCKDEDQTAIDDAKKQVTDANTAVSAAQAKVDTASETLGTDGITEDVKAQAEADLAAAQKELEEASTKLADANKAVEDATNKAFENIDADADAILASLDAGEDWNKLMDEKNQDPGMKNNEKGYAVATGMTNFDAAFVDAAMALEKIGDHSGKVKGTSYGYYIVRYDADEPEGAIALDEVKEKISSSLLSTKQTNTYNDQIDKWVEESGIKVDLNALND